MVKKFVGDKTIHVSNHDKISLSTTSETVSTRWLEFNLDFNL